jgi:hypothetical protein
MAPTAIGTAEARSGGGLYRVYYDAVRAGWFVRGVYD